MNKDNRAKARSLFPPFAEAPPLAGAMAMLPDILLTQSGLAACGKLIEHAVEQC